MNCVLVSDTRNLLQVFDNSVQRQHTTCGDSAVHALSAESLPDTRHGALVDVTVSVFEHVPEVALPLRHPEADEFTCDGTWHTGTWRITSDPSDPGFEYGHGALIPGQVYVQFCWDGPDWHAYDEQFARAS